MVERFPALVRRSRFQGLAVTMEHALLAGGLDVPSRDPFDRMLLAQATIEKAALVSGDSSFRDRGIAVIWN